MAEQQYILSQHKVLHKVKYKHFLGEVFCKCDYHGYYYVDVDDKEEYKKCKKCFKKKE